MEQLRQVPSRSADGTCCLRSFGHWSSGKAESHGHWHGVSRAQGGQTGPAESAFLGQRPGVSPENGGRQVLRSKQGRSSRTKETRLLNPGHPSSGKNSIKKRKKPIRVVRPFPVSCGSHTCRNPRQQKRNPRIRDWFLLSLKESCWLLSTRVGRHRRTCDVKNKSSVPCAGRRFG